MSNRELRTPGISSSSSRGVVVVVVVVVVDAVNSSSSIRPCSYLNHYLDCP